MTLSLNLEFLDKFADTTYIEISLWGPENLWAPINLPTHPDRESVWVVTDEQLKHYKKILVKDSCWHKFITLRPSLPLTPSPLSHDDVLRMYNH